MTQTITSERTAINHIPAMIRRIAWQAGSINFDIGGGPYNTVTSYLQKGLGVTNLVYDPFNRTDSENEDALKRVNANAADTCTIVNVLNVIREDDAKVAVLQLARLFTKSGGSIYVGIHEGNRFGTGAVTTKGWQENKKRDQYYKYLREVWPADNITFIKHGFVVENT